MLRTRKFRRFYCVDLVILDVRLCASIRANNNTYKHKRSYALEYYTFVVIVAAQYIRCGERERERVDSSNSEVCFLFRLQRIHLAINFNLLLQLLLHVFILFDARSQYPRWF